MKLLALLTSLSVAVLALSSCDDDADTDRAGAEAGGSASFALPWPSAETWFFVGGPHCDSAGEECSDQPRYALDFAPIAPMYGNLCVPSVIEQYWVTAAAPGTVRVTDRSLVEIEHESGLRTGYYHLLTSSISVAPGDLVEQGDRLGHPSCEHLRGGESSGPHVHFYVCRASMTDQACLGDQELLLSAEGRELGGWTIGAGDANYEGTLERGGELREAVNDRCDNSDQADNCGSIRNDIVAP